MKDITYQFDIISSLLHKEATILNNESQSSFSAALVHAFLKYFDPGFYSSIYPDINQSNVSPQDHYIRYGFLEGRIPGPKLFLQCFDHNPEYLVKRFYSDLLQESSQSNTIIKRAGSIDTLYDMPLFVNWIMTLMCNYKCSYCFGQSPLCEARFPTIDNLFKIIDNLASLNRSTYKIWLTGGEVTAYPHLIPLIYTIHAKLGKRLSHLNIYSNGYRNIDYFNYFADFARIASFSLTISLHSEYVSIKHINELIKRYADKFQLNFNLMFNPEKFEYTKEIFSNLILLRESYPFSCGIVYLRQKPRFDKIDSRYTEEHIKWSEINNKRFAEIEKKYVDARLVKSSLYTLFWEYKDNNTFHTYPINNVSDNKRQEMFKNGQFAFNNMFCIGGAHSLAIDPDGTCRTLRCGHNQIIGNWFKEKYIFVDKSFHISECKAPNCGCTANDAVMKFSNKLEANIFLNKMIEKQKELLNGKQF